MRPSHLQRTGENGYDLKTSEKTGNPECSNCRKAGIECNSSNTLKRVNHMKQLRDDFTDVVKQLGDVDQTLNMLTDLVRQLSTARSAKDHGRTSHDALSPPLIAGLPDFLQNSDRNDDQGPSSGLSAPQPSRETVEQDECGERLYRYPAPMVLIESLFHQTDDLLLCSEEDGDAMENDEPHDPRGLRDPALRVTIQERLDGYPCNPRCAELSSTGDAGPVTTPPRLMVNLFIDGYLRNFNARTPIFNEHELHRAIDAHYSDEQLHESRAWGLIMNNIVLLELGLEIQTARASHSTSRVTNDEILPSFLRNCDRAIANLNAFMTPGLVNLQALMTLTLAAQEFYASATAERVCHAACQVGRIMGIHRSRDAEQAGGGAGMALTSEADRDRLFRILYAMDKQRVFMTGQPCDLYMFDSNRRMGSSNGHRTISNAFDHLMTTWEEIYLKLLTSGAAGAGKEMQSRHVRHVADSLDKFGQRYNELLSLSHEPQIEGDADLLRVELLYGFQVSKILVIQCDRSNQQSRHKILDLARSSLRLIVELCRPPLTTARFALLARMFRRYPMVAFVELISAHLTSLSSRGGPSLDPVKAREDMAVLRAVSEKLRMMQYDNLAHTFYARLHSGLSWALETLEIIAEHLLVVAVRPTPPKSRRPTTESLRNPRSTPGSSSAATTTTTTGLSPETPGLFPSTVTNHNAAPSAMIQPYLSSRPQSSSHHHDEDEFGTIGVGVSGSSIGAGGRPTQQAHMTNFGFYTPPTDAGDVMSRPLSPVCRPGAASSSYFPTVEQQQRHHHHQQPQAPADLSEGTSSSSLLGNQNWVDFNLDFFPGSFAQGVRWG
ncbi:hypothetical protein F5Y17DRAFT_455747 [Xylariaceae sp. FL0594]|nr:hypothetical protein F5Y17DRAFT_455747 [Xylariaceae sp. FL0594]